MIRISKLVLGIRPSQKMFRVESLAGSAIDAILAARSDKTLGDDYFTSVGKAADRSSYRLFNEDQGNVLQIEEANVVFTKDVYLDEQHIDLEDVLAEWRLLWKHVNGVLAVRDIRRIGIVAEHQFKPPNGTASGRLFEGLAAIPRPQHPGKFMLQFEDRRPTTNKVGLPDPTKDAFINVIQHYYDSELDTEHATSGFINANLDVQKYFSPLFNGNIFDEIDVLLKLFKKEKAGLDAEIAKRGLI